MKTVKKPAPSRIDTSAVFHAFAHQLYPDLKSYRNHYKYIGKSLYSYNREIAKIVKKPRGKEKGIVFIQNFNHISGWGKGHSHHSVRTSFDSEKWNYYIADFREFPKDMKDTKTLTSCYEDILKHEIDKFLYSYCRVYDIIHTNARTYGIDNIKRIIESRKRIIRK